MLSTKEWLNKYIKTTLEAYTQYENSVKDGNTDDIKYNKNVLEEQIDDLIETLKDFIKENNN